MLAAGLQVMPMLRAVLPVATQGLAPSTWAIVLKFAAGSVALLGSYHAVSGATAIVAPYTVNATVGTRYTRQLGTSGQTAHSWSANTAPLGSAVFPLTPGLYLTNSNGKIGGLPSWAGTSNIIIKAWEKNGNSGASVSATFVFTIANSSAGTPPAITQQPQDQTVTAGQTVNFSVAATGTAPLAYYWRKGATVIQTGSSSSFAIANAQAANAGTYSVIVSNSAGMVLSANAILSVNTAVTPPTITLQPQSQTITAGQTASFAVTANGTAPLTYYWRKGAVVVQAGSRATYAIASAQTADAAIYSVIVSNSAGIVTSAEAVLSVTLPLDSIRPKLTVAFPLALLTSVTSNTIILRGKATDNIGIGGVFIQRGSEAPVQTEGTTNWSCTVPLVAGSNLFRIKSVDLAGNVSLTNTRTVFCIVTNPLTLTINGGGRVIGVTNGQPMVIGRSRRLTAVPATGYVFSNWLGSVVASNTTITLLMSANAALTANFVLNPFTMLGGTYTGLFFETNNPAHESAGYFSVGLTGNGVFSTRLIGASRTLAGTGKFGLDLHSQKTFGPVATNPPVVVDLQLTEGSDEITGTVIDGVRTLNLFGYRAVFGARNRATNYAGLYTALLPGSGDPALTPSGHGCLTLSASALGPVKLMGNLADGTPVLQSRLLAASGAIPFYNPLYHGRGSAFGWLTLAPSDTSDVHGRLLWTKRPGVPDAFYPAGFEKSIDVMGSRYQAPPFGTPALDLPSVVLLLSGGNLDSPLSHDVALQTSNRVIITNNTSRVALQLNRLTGLMTGSFLNPATHKTSAIKGVLLQKQAYGAGFLLGTNQSGVAYLGAPLPVQ